MAKKTRMRLVPMLAGMMLLIWAIDMPSAVASPFFGVLTLPGAALQAAVPDTIAVTTLPNHVFNGEAITFYARCVNPGLKPVTAAGFYVGSTAVGMKKVSCVQEVSALSEAATVYFEAEMSLPQYAGGIYKAFVQCGDEEIVGEGVPFDARPPLPPPAVNVLNGMKYTAEELALSWDGVGGAAIYGVALRDTTKGAGGAYLLGKESNDAATGYYWVDGSATQVKTSALGAKLTAGHTYRLTVCSAYDKHAVFGKSVDFQIISVAAAGAAAPSVGTRLYCKNKDGTVTLYGTVDCQGRPLAEYGFYMGKTKGSLQRKQIETPGRYANNAFSLTVSVSDKNSGTLYYRAYATGENGIEQQGDLKEIDLGEADPFTPAKKAAKIDDNYVPLLAAIDPGWSFMFIKTLPYNYANMDIKLLDGWEKQHILKGFAFPGKAININKGAVSQYKLAVSSLNKTRVKVLYKDGVITSFLLKDLVQTAASYNARYISPINTNENGTRLPPDQWGWRLSQHSWGVSVDINAFVPVNRQKGINFTAIRNGAVKLSRKAGTDSDGAIVLAYDGYSEQGKLVPDDVLNYILYELAFKKAGFYWGGYFGGSRTDPMHFSLIEIPARREIPLAEVKDMPNE